jgi:N-acetylmuramoyl-L-alanine amidase
MKLIHKYKSVNFNIRVKNESPKLIILHYTAMFSSHEALTYLSNPKNKVSSHFLISKSGDIFNLVDVRYRAWHAGVSCWKKIRDINSNSVGIEIDNSGHLHKFENYRKEQIASLIDLLKYLMKKFKIHPINIIGHSDIAPYRKIDPGEKFPWRILYKNKLSFLPKKLHQSKSKFLEKYFLSKSLKDNKRKAIHMLNEIGYEVIPCFKDSDKFSLLIKAYQMHFVRTKVDGQLDIKTYEIIKGHFIEILIN